MLNPYLEKNAFGQGNVNNVKLLFWKNASGRGSVNNVNNVKSDLGLLGIESHWT